MPRSPAVRAAAAVAAVVLIVIGWYLGSPLFIRTTTFEDFPTPAASAAVSSAAPSAGGLISVSTGNTPVVTGRGELGYVDPLHNGTGQVLVIRTGDQQVLRFENVAITNAPDVHVYLSRDTGGRWSEATSLYLGPLKATNGSFNYDIPASADRSAYKSVVVWCRMFSVLVTWADLGPT